MSGLSKGWTHKAGLGQPISGSSGAGQARVRLEKLKPARTGKEREGNAWLVRQWPAGKEGGL